MIALSNATSVYLFTQATDMRKAFDRLAELVKEELKRSALAGGLFVFVSRRRDRLKVPFWDRDGYALFYKRLDAGVFRVEEQDGVERITGIDLKLLREGMDLSRIMGEEIGSESSESRLWTEFQPKILGKSIPTIYSLFGTKAFQFLYYRRAE